LRHLNFTVLVRNLMHFSFAFSQCLQVFIRPLIIHGKLNFRGYLISQFYPLVENLMHTENMFYSILFVWTLYDNVQC